MGATSALGEDFSRFAAESGASLVLTGRDEQKLGQLASDLGEAFEASFAAPIEDIDGFKHLLRSASSSDKPYDGVFHCAGRESIASVRSVKDRDFDAVFSVSFKGAAALAATCAGKGFMNPGGSLLLMSSVVSHRPQSGMALYSASKAAIDALVKSAAEELAGKSIRINSLVAGAVQSPMLEQSMKVMPPPAQERYRGAHLLGFGNPRDISLAAGYLLSDAARWVTGTTMVVDGGFLSA